METILEKPYLDFFQEFINLCESHNWPTNDTNSKEIKNAFLKAEHIEKCLDKLQKKCLINEFLNVLYNNQNTSCEIVKKYLSNPTKYILKKIINPSTNITIMDVGFKTFLDLFSEEKLEEYLSDIILEAASKDTLLKNMSLELSADNRLDFKTHVLLSELNGKEGSRDAIKGMLNNCTQDVMDILILCLISKEMKYNQIVDIIVKEFINVMSNQNVSNKNFWKLLLRTNVEVLIKVCLTHNHIFELLAKALIKCGKLINQCFCMKDFYIELTYSELVSNVQKICRNEELKMEFMNLLQIYNEDMSIWNTLFT